MNDRTFLLENSAFSCEKCLLRKGKNHILNYCLRCTEAIIKQMKRAKYENIKPLEERLLKQICQEYGKLSKLN